MFDRISTGVAQLIGLGAITLGVFGAFLGTLYGSELAMLALGVTMLAVGAWWLTRQPKGTPFHELAWPVSVATVVPLLVGSHQFSPEFPQASVTAWLIGAGAAATLGLTLADTLPARQRAAAGLATSALALAAAGLGLFLSSTSFVPGGRLPNELATLLLAATTAVPGVAAGIAEHNQPSQPRARWSVVAALELGVIGITPAISVLTVWDAGGSPLSAIPLVIWIIVVLAAFYFAVRPLMQTAAVAVTQRDMVVTAMEAERARIAADIHDDALQELTLLGWQLDSSGYHEAALTAREVADRLRAITGDLRLPILDDLGTGPALEWLVERMGRLSGGDIRLERSDSVRPPSDVELAFFRIAQEALSNAVRHGHPPVVVRYWTSSSGASLSVDDSGPGFEATNSDKDASGHFGLLNMRQRAEQIGALVDVRPWPSGGTRVTLEWRARTT